MMIRKMLVLGTLIVALTVAPSAFAETPAGCNTNAVGISITPFVLGSPTTGPVQLGDVITYRVTLSVPPLTPPSIGCNFAGGELAVTLPDGTYVPTAGFGGPTPPVPTVSNGSPFAVDCPTDYVVTAADVTAGTITALADYGATARYPGQVNGTFDSVTPQQTASATTSNALPVTPPQPCITITKVPLCDTSKVGDLAEYHYCLHNCGPTAITIQRITDDKLGELLADYLASCPEVLEPDDEEPGGPDECCFTAGYVVPDGSPDPLPNRVEVEGTDAFGQLVMDDDDAQIDLVQPCFTVTKTCLTDPVIEGQPARFEICIDNCGTVDLIITTDEDELPGEISLPEGQEICIEVERVVEPGATEVCNAITVNARVDHPCLDNVLEPKSARDCCTVPGEDGCTPGYWKNSPGCWECAVPYGPEATTFEDVFGEVIEIRLGGKTTVTGPTLMQALNASGGGINALARHAVAAYLNACDPDVDYPMSVDQVIAAVQAAIPDGDIEGTKNMLAMNNELGCPQSSDNANEPCSPEVDEAPV